MANNLLVYFYSDDLCIVKLKNTSINPLFLILRIWLLTKKLGKFNCISVSSFIEKSHVIRKIIKMNNNIREGLPWNII